MGWADTAGGKREDTSDERGFLGRIAENLDRLWSGASGIPAGFTREAVGVGKTLQTLAPGGEEPTVYRPEPAGGGTFVPESYEKEPIEFRWWPEDEGFLSGLGKGFEGWEKAPGARFTPGVETGSKVSRGESLLEDPLFTLIDVLPVGTRALRAGTAPAKAAKTATRLAKKAGRPAEEVARLADEAAETARRSQRTTYRGTRKTGKQRFREQGWSPEEAAELGMATQGFGIPAQTMRGLRKGEQALGERFPGAQRWLPSELLQSAGFGSKTRDLMARLGTAERRFVQDVSKVSDEIFKKADEFGLPQERVVQLSRLMEEGSPGWRSRLSDAERGYVRWYETQLQRFRHLGEREGKLLNWGGEVYSVSDNPALSKAIRGYQQALARGKKAEDVLARGEDLKTYRLKDPSAYRNIARQAAERADRLAARTPPARFRPVMEPRIKEAVKRVARNRNPDVTGPEWERIVRYIEEGEYGAVPNLTNDKLNRIAAGVNARWHQLRDAGYDPLFVHHVTPEGAKRLFRPRLDPTRINTPSELKKRGWNMDSWVPDVQIALASQALDWMNKQHSASFAKELADSGVIRTAEAIRAELMPRAERIADQGQLGRTFKRMVNDKYTKFEPETIFPFKGAQRMLPESEALYMPKGMANALRKAMPKEITTAQNLISGPMRLFRASVLSLSPFYYINNAMSGALLLTIRSQPGGMRFMRQAVRMMREGELPPELSRGAKMALPAQANASYSYKVGQKMGDLLKETYDVGGGPVKRTFERLQGFANNIDDMYKTMAYLEGKTKAQRFGLGEEASKLAGLDLAHKVLQNFDRMVPMERLVLRMAVPFISWSKFVLQYAFSLPFDHPMRVSIMSDIAQYSIEDLGEGLPERFRNYLWFGKPDEKGTKYAYSMTGPLPLTDVSNYFTFAGLMSRVSPIAQGLLEQTGVDTFGYGPDPFADVHYDPVSGRERIDRPGLAGIVEQLSPQIEAVGEIVPITRSDYMRKLAVEDRQAFYRRLLGGFGVRIPPRYAPEEEIEKAERARERVERQQRYQERERQRLEQGGGGGGGWAGTR